MSALQGGQTHDGDAPASAPTASLPPDAPNRPTRSWQRTVVAGSAAISVGLLSLSSIGLLFVAAVGVALDLMGVSMPVVWSAVGLAGVVAAAASCRLAVDAWRYETDEATDIV